MSKFNLGKLVTSAMVNLRMAGDPAFDLHTVKCLARHAHGDWGDVPPEDKAINDQALATPMDGFHSVYRHPEHPELWIITDHGRETTTLLFPEDY